MRIVCQRVKNAVCIVEGEIVGKIDHGLLLFVGFTHFDTIEKIKKAVKKVIQLRIFEDENQKMNLNIQQVHGSILSISQFTVYANTQNGNRPSFTEAMEPNQANQFYKIFNQFIEAQDVKVATGVFGKHMDIIAANDGPVTLILEV